jgi:nucleotide-binding universal stress UspA family protein
MDDVRQWVFTICSGTLLCGVVSVLLPGQNSQRLMSMVLGLFMLCCFLLPAGIDLELPSPDLEGAEEARNQAADEMTDYFLQDTLRRSQEELTAAAAKELQEYGINEKDIQIYIETDESKDEGTPEVILNITLPEEAREKHDEIRRILEYELGAEVRLEYGGEGT